MATKIKTISFEGILEQFDNLIVVQDGYQLTKPEEVEKNLPALCVAKLAFIVDSNPFLHYFPEIF